MRLLEFPDPGSLAKINDVENPLTIAQPPRPEGPAEDQHLGPLREQEQKQTTSRSVEI